MIQRKRIYEKAAPSRDAQKIYVFCEGDEREKEYFEFFEGMSSNLEIISIAPYDHKSSPNNLMTQAESLFYGDTPSFEIDYEQHDMIWFVIDTDEWAEAGLIRLLRHYCEEKNSGIKYTAWCVAQSNPSFEIWLYYHVYAKMPNEKEVKACNSFKDYVNGKILGGFDSRIMPIYIENAITNSKANYATNDDGPSKYSTEVYMLGEYIVKYAKYELQIKKRTIV